ncbi:MAG: hypothetical protein PHO37_17615 [Kiritimatiellae bacterium]|nr:hypothetical protein [Kiritimatiellia bacterium]
MASSRTGVGGAMLTTSNIYNNPGQIIQTINHDGASTVFDYNELGERTATISVAAGQTRDFNPQGFTLEDVIARDKYVISLTTESTESTEGEWWRCATSIFDKPGENALTTSVHRTQLTGLTLQNNSCSILIDADTTTGSIRTMDYNDDTPSVTNYYNLNQRSRNQTEPM